MCIHMYMYVYACLLHGRVHRVHVLLDCKVCKQDVYFVVYVYWSGFRKPVSFMITLFVIKLMLLHIVVLDTFPLVMFLLNYHVHVLIHVTYVHVHVTYVHATAL